MKMNKSNINMSKCCTLNYLELHVFHFRIIFPKTSRISWILGNVLQSWKLNLLTIARWRVDVLKCAVIAQRWIRPRKLAEFCCAREVRTVSMIEYCLVCSSIICNSDVIVECWCVALCCSEKIYMCTYIYIHTYIYIIYSFRFVYFILAR